jgi:sugar-specific transcriptional regulator TrmB
MERILLNFRESEYRNYISQAASAKSKAQDFINKLQDIASIDIPSDAISDIYLSHGERVAHAIEKKVREELQLAKITSSTVINSAIKGDLEKYYKLLNTKPIINTEFASVLTVKENKVEYSKDPETLKENFTHYISTERGKEIYDKQKAMIEAINDFLAFVPAFSALNIFHVIPTMGTNAKKIELVELSYDTL